MTEEFDFEQYEISDWKKALSHPCEKIKLSAIMKVPEYVSEETSVYLLTDLITHNEESLPVYSVIFEVLEDLIDSTETHSQYEMIEATFALMKFNTDISVNKLAQEFLSNFTTEFLDEYRSQTDMKDETFNLFSNLLG